MINERKVFNLLSLIVAALLVSSCGGIGDLVDDNRKIEQDYGLIAGHVDGLDGVDKESRVLIGLFKRDDEELSIHNLRTVNLGEAFFIPVQKAEYEIIAFLDSNRDSVYQAEENEPAARVDARIIGTKDIKLEENGRCFDYSALQTQPIPLARNPDPKIDMDLDFSPGAIFKIQRFRDVFLKEVSWDYEKFSAENVELGLWKRSSFYEDVGYGLYVLEEFDPTKKTIVLVHGISDSPPVFKTLANNIPDDYQLLLFHYPSAVSLDYTSYILSIALNELIRLYPIPQLDIIAHSMGGLVSKGMIYQSSEELRQRMRLFISIASPYGGHGGAAWGLKTPALFDMVAPVWCAMAPESTYLQTIAKLDLLDPSKGPRHHLFYAYSQERDGEREDSDGVVSVNSQRDESAMRNATAVYGIADNHVGAVSNPCTLELLKAILKDGNTRAVVPNCAVPDK